MSQMTPWTNELKRFHLRNRLNFGCMGQMPVYPRDTWIMGTITRKRQAGFTLIEAILACAFLQILALGFAHVMNVAKKDQHSIAVDAEWEQKFNQISRTLKDPNGCTPALATMHLDPSSLTTEILGDTAGEAITLYVTNNPSILLAQNGLSWPGNSTVDLVQVTNFIQISANTYEGSLNITTSKAAGTNTGAGTRIRTFPIRIGTTTISATDEVVVSCQAQFDSLTQTQCDELMGNWDPNRNPKCRVRQEFNVDNNIWTPYLNGFDQPVTFVAPPNQVMRGYDTYHSNGPEDNRIKFLMASACDGSLPLETVNCADYPSAAGWVNGFDAPVDFQCGANQYMTQEQSQHGNAAEDRRYRYRCCELEKPGGSSVTRTNCEWSGMQNTWDMPVKFTCSKGKIMTGARSFHANGPEDRIYYFQCCGLD